MVPQGRIAQQVYIYKVITGIDKYGVDWLHCTEYERTVAYFPIFLGVCIRAVGRSVISCGFLTAPRLSTPSPAFCAHGLVPVDRIEGPGEGGRTRIPPPTGKPQGPN